MDNFETNNTNNDNNNHKTTMSTNGINGLEIKSNYDKDVVILIGQHLTNLGLKQTVQSLLAESKLGTFEHPSATKFNQHILNGQWDEAKKMLKELSLYIEQDNIDDRVKEMQLLIAEQNFLEYLEDGLPMKALMCLRDELTPYLNDDNHLQHLTKLLMCKSVADVRRKANWPGKGQKSRQILIEKYHRNFPPSFMLPPRRLDTLIKQALDYQIERCMYHNFKRENSDHIDLKCEHNCQPTTFPSALLETHRAHTEEVWFCKFSNNGKRLATAGLGGKIIIWKVDVNKKSISEKFTLECQCSAVACLAWSPNDQYLLVCGSEDRPDAWLWDVDAKKVRCTLEKTDEDHMLTCSWHPSGDMFALGSTKGNFKIYDRDGTQKYYRVGVRVQCLSFFNKDHENILAADALNRIRMYQINDMSLEGCEDTIIEERHSIMSFCLDSDDRYIAVNLLHQGVHLWDFKLRTLVTMFLGVKERSFTIYSSFSPLERKYLASGSEDCKIYIYSLDKNEPQLILTGHKGTVNCVSWNPRYPELIASASDDKTVRLWGPCIEQKSAKSPKTFVA